uniref:KTSC domain-containing protein n=1 Tax=Ascaris lumbricoides TaxID=6252 RepID=A0A0M3HG61_ASCLU
SLLRVEAELQIVRAYDRPESQLDYTSSYIKLIEFLGFNGDHELYINRRNATFEDIYRHTRIPNHSWEVRPKIERYRRRRKRQPEILHVQTNEERGRDRDVAFNDRKAHILIKEQSCVTSARRVNMDEKRNRRRAASLEAEERQHRRKKSEKRKGRKKARKHPREQKIGKKAAMAACLKSMHGGCMAAVHIIQPMSKTLLLVALAMLNLWMKTQPSLLSTRH